MVTEMEDVPVHPTLFGIMRDAANRMPYVDHPITRSVRIPAVACNTAPAIHSAMGQAFAKKVASYGLAPDHFIMGASRWVWLCVDSRAHPRERVTKRAWRRVRGRVLGPGYGRNVPWSPR